MKKQLVIHFLILLSVIGCSKPPATTPPSYPVSVTKSIQRDTPLYTQYVGHIEAYTTVDLKSQIEGVLMAQHFENGAEVKKGDLLFTIDPRPYEANLAYAEATLALNIANLKLAENTAQRYARLVQEDYVSQLDYEQYLTQVAVNQASVKQSAANLENAKLNLEYCYIRAPMDAIAGNVPINVGNLIPNAGQTSLVTLNQVKPVYVSFYIPESDLPTVMDAFNSNLLEVIAYLNQDKEHPFLGNLSSIDNQVEENTGTIYLRATFPNEDKKLWPGEYSDIRLITGFKKNAILLPNEAIVIGADGPCIFVLKSNTNTVELRKIVVGQRQDNFTIIEKGVEAGETVVLAGQLNLYDGAKVEIKTGNNP